MKQISTICRRYRWLLLAAGYLLVLAAGVMYLRVTISVPLEGDDRLTINGWLYDLQRMPFWQYLLQDLRWRLSYFTLEQVRFFPFHYPSAVSLLFFGSLSSYRLYIIGVTAAAAFLVSLLTTRLSRSGALGLGAFALALGLAPIFNEGMYSYYAVPQKALFWAMAAWLCLLRGQDTGHKRWAVGAALLAFLSCGTYEIGYMYGVLALVVWAVLRRSVVRGLRGCAPVLGGTAVALVFHLASSGGSGSTGNALSLNFAEIGRDEKFVRSNPNTLYVPKDGRRSDSVLTSIFETYLKSRSVRETNDLYEDMLELRDDGYYYRDNRIENIVFLCDNFECGAATIRMLKAYLNIDMTDERSDEQRRVEQVRASRQKYYLRETNSSDGNYDLSAAREHLKEVTLKNVIKKNDCTIEVHGYYGTERGQQAIEEFLEKQHIKSAVVTYEKKITQHASQIIDEAKHIWPRFSLRDNVYTVVREFNMPKANIFPEEMLKDPGKAICMFVKKDEIQKC